MNIVTKQGGNETRVEGFLEGGGGDARGNIPAQVPAHPVGDHH